jgi:putative PIN family toxin of toxin-antitoxin system
LRILVDTNILISALLYPQGSPSRALLHAAENHELFLSDYNISELHHVVKKKFPHMMADIDVLLAKLSFELVVAPISPEKLISDPKDAPVLNAALVADIDIIISGDKHFHELILKRPIVKSAIQYIEYVKNL